jgi:hypothetical protein
VSSEIIVGLFASIFGGMLVAIANQLFTRNKTRAETKKIEAEAEKIQAETAKLLSELNLEEENFVSDRQLPSGWIAAGSHPEDYDMGVDHKVYYSGSSGSASAYIKSRASAQGFGTLMQMCKVDKYLGKRLRMSGYVKTEQVVNRTGLWMRIDGPNDKSVSFDNMQNRPIKGTTDWEKYEIILDVPENSIRLAFGIILNGKGQAWVDNLKFDIVDENVPVTDLKQERTLPEEPINLNFED